MENTAQEVASLFSSMKNKRVLLATHVNPDGDAVGAVGAFGHMAEAMGAEVRMLLISGMPESFAWLDLPWPAVPTLAELNGFVPHMVVVADCGDADRAGPELTSFFRDKILPEPGWTETQSLNVDHHEDNPQFATYNLVDPHKAATGELAGDVAEYLGLPLTGALGECIYTCLVTDTGNFTYANTTASVLSMASTIVGNGLPVGAFMARLENTWSIGRMNLWGRMLTQMNLYGQGAIACSVATLDLLAEFDESMEALEGYASFMRRLDGVRVSLFVREKTSGNSKVSLRSMGDVDVQKIAAFFGGGGHTAASGADIAAPADEAKTLVLAKLYEAMGITPD